MEKSSQQKASFGQGLELAIVILKAFVSIAKKTGPSSNGIQKLIDKPGTIYKCIENLFSDVLMLKLPVLKLISAGEKIMVESSDGKPLISKAKNTFKSWIEPCFIDWRFNKVSAATPETLLDIYEMVNDATFMQMFTELNSDLDKLAMTQSQIILFCEKYPNWLRQEGSTTFFLIKGNDKHFVVYVLMRSDGLFVDVIRFGYENSWDTKSRYRIVVPQMETLSV